MSSQQTTPRITHVAMKNVTKLFGTVRALNRLSLEMGEGEALAVMGANGAGKSTLLSLLSLSARPTRGEIRFNGRADRSASVLRRIGILSHAPMLYPDLTAEENLLLFAKLYGQASPAARVAALAEEMGLSSFMKDRPARVLSRGQLQRRALARPIVHRPDLLLLDDPAAGLDSPAVRRIETVIKEHSQGGGMAVIVTHEPDIAARIADRAVLLRRGNLVLDAPAPGDADKWRAFYMDAVGE